MKYTYTVLSIVFCMVLYAPMVHGAAADMLRVIVTTNNLQTELEVGRHATFNDLLVKAKPEFVHPSSDARTQWEPELKVAAINGRNVELQFDVNAHLSDFEVTDGSVVRVSFRYQRRKKASGCGVQ